MKFWRKMLDHVETLWLFGGIFFLTMAAIYATIQVGEPKSIEDPRYIRPAVYVTNSADRLETWLNPGEDVLGPNTDNTISPGTLANEISFIPEGAANINFACDSIPWTKLDPDSAEQQITIASCAVFELYYEKQPRPY